MSSPFHERHPVLFAGLIILVVCAAQTFFMGLPAFVGLLADGRGFSGSQLGTVVSAEIAGNTLGSLLIAFSLARQSVRRIVVVALLCMLIANGLMAWQPGYGTALMARALSGIGCGTLSGLGLRYLSYGKHVELKLGLVVTAQSLYSLLLLTLVVPATGSAAGSYLLLAVLALASLPAASLFGPREVMLREAAARGADVQPVGAYLSLAALLALYGGVGIVWTFIERVGPSTGMTSEAVAELVGMGSVVSLVSCLIVPPLLARGLRWGTGVVVLGACAASAAFLAVAHTPWTFSAAAMVFLSCWNGAAIVLFATTPVYDAAGRHVTLAPAFLGVGYGIGSAMGGVMLDMASPAAAFGAAAAWCLLATLLYAALRGARQIPPEAPHLAGAA